MNDTTYQGNGKIAYVPVVVNAKPPKPTNYDRLRAKSVEEMAEFIAEGFPKDVCRDRCGGDESFPCSECVLDWLKQEVDG